MKRIFVVFLALAPAASAAAAVPGLISFQTRLADSAGVPLNGTVALAFRVFNASSAGTQLASGTGSTTSETVSWANTGTTTAAVYVAVKRYAGSSTTTPYNLALTR